MKQTDERDIIFARCRYKPESANYKDYYERNPHKKEKDDSFRAVPFLGDENSTFFHSLYSNINDANFQFLADLHNLCDEEPVAKKMTVCKQDITKHIKGLLKFYGAGVVGITKAKKELYYSHYGRPENMYGKKVNAEYETAIVFACEMQEEMIFCAPRLPSSIAVTKGYVDAAVIGLQLAYYIRSMGYRAVNNMDGKYLLPLVPVAVNAGLGELGLNSMLITKEYGPRIRLGAVLTDLPLDYDEKNDFGLEGFCKICLRCKKSCPGKAILPNEEKYFSDDNCFTMWQNLGTDCGVCIAACPFSNHLPKDLIDGLKKDNGAKALLDYCDENMPRRPYIASNPEWLK